MQMKAKAVARIVAFLALAMASACGPAAPVGQVGEAPTDGFTLEVFANEGEQVYLVRHADGRQAAARVADGASSLMEASAAQALLIERANAIAAPDDEDLSIRAPGFSLSVASDEKAGTNDRARIEIQTGGQSVLVDAQGDDEDGRAIVRIAGANEHAARNFIDDADGLSAETRAQMLAALRL